MKAGNKVGLMSQMSQIALGCLTCSYSAPGRPHAPRRRQLTARIARDCKAVSYARELDDTITKSNPCATEHLLSWIGELRPCEPWPFLGCAEVAQQAVV